MVALAGTLHTLDYAKATMCKGHLGDWKFYAVPLGPAYYYRMRAWVPLAGEWEVWTSTGAPTTTPPSGRVVSDVTLIGVWAA